LVYFISKQVLLSTNEIREETLKYGVESPFSIKISCFNCFSKRETKNDYKEKMLRKLNSEEILNLIKTLDKYMKNENNDDNSNLLQNEFVIRIPYNEDKNKKYKEDKNKEDEENLDKEYQKDNYTLDFSLEIDINKEKIDKEKEYKVFIIKSDGYTNMDLNKDCIKEIGTIKKKNEFIMNNFHITFLGTLKEISKKKGYKINLPTNSTNVKNGFWKFQILIICRTTNGIEFHKSYPFSTITSRRMFRDEKKTNKRKTNKSETNESKMKESYITRIILKSEDKKFQFTKKLKWIEMLKYYRDIIIEAAKNNKIGSKFELKFASTTQEIGEIKVFLEKNQKKVDEILITENNIKISKDYMILYDQNVFNGDIFNESLFNEKKYEEKVNEKQKISKMKQLQEKDKGPIRAEENQYLDNTESPEESRSQQYQEENEGPFEVYENQYYDNAELTQENRSDQHQEKYEGPIEVFENQYHDNSELTQESRSEQHQEENDGPIRADENQYQSEQLQETNLGFNERKRKALKEIEHGNNKKNK